MEMDRETKRRLGYATVRFAEVARQTERQDKPSRMLDHGETAIGQAMQRALSQAEIAAQTRRGIVNAKLRAWGFEPTSIERVFGKR